MRVDAPCPNVSRRLLHHFDKLWIGLYLFEIGFLIGVDGNGLSHDSTAIPAPRFRQFFEKAV